MKNKNIVLIGFMGSGKTSVARELAKISGYKFIETDDKVRHNCRATIVEIFQEKGEEFFRQEETKVLKALKDEKDLKNTIISTGGGIIIKPENVEILKSLGSIFFLEASRETILKRVFREKSRPLLENVDKEAQIEKLLEKRMPIYFQAADYVIKTDNKSVNDIAQEILNTLSKVGKNIKLKS